MPCPNACGIQAIKRGDLEAHLLQCPLETVECDFVHAGCNVELLRQDLEKHMEENTQKHMALVPALTEQRHDQLQRELENEQQKMEAIEKRQEQLQKKTQENEAKINHLQQQLQQKVQRTEELGDIIEMPNFKQYADNQEMWYSPPRYTHPGGYRFGIAVRADDGTGRNQMAVYFYSVMGRFDRMLKWPLCFTITLELLNQERNQDHITVTGKLNLEQTDADQGYVIRRFGKNVHSVFQNTCIIGARETNCVLSVLHNTQYNDINRIRYLKNDCHQSGTVH